jgi:hypothetical protein
VSFLFCFFFFDSSISVWCKNCDDLEIGEDEKDTLDKFIDQLYDDLERGNNIDNFSFN